VPHASRTRSRLPGPGALVGRKLLPTMATLGGVDETVQDPLGGDRVGEQAVPVRRCPGLGPRSGLAGVACGAAYVQEQGAGESG